MSYRVRVSPRAERQIEEVAGWWFENRSAAPHLFSDEVERAFLALKAFPNAGQAVAHPRIENVRRILLSSVHYHLYYSVAEESETIEILELWHTSRAEPEL